MFDTASAMSGTAFNSLFEMPVAMVDDRGHVTVSFNSLFEMRHTASPYCLNHFAQSFNSLFEMHRTPARVPVFEIDNVLSILYLRCRVVLRRVSALKRQAFNSLFEMQEVLPPPVKPARHG